MIIVEELAYGYSDLDDFRVGDDIKFSEEIY
jgi:hypothetical protein